MATDHHRPTGRVGIAAAALAAVLLLAGCPADAGEGDDDAPRQPVPGATSDGEDAEGEDAEGEESEDAEGEGDD